MEAQAIKRQWNWAAAVELTLAIATFLIVREVAHAYEIRGGGSIAILSAVILVTPVMYLRRQSWADLGLRLPKNWLGWLGIVLYSSLVLVLKMAHQLTVAILPDLNPPSPLDYTPRVAVESSPWNHP